MKETFARSSVSCLTGADLQSVTAVRGDPCWQVTQQLHLLIEKVRQQQKHLHAHRVSKSRPDENRLFEAESNMTSPSQPPPISVCPSALMTQWLFGQMLRFLAFRKQFSSPRPAADEKNKTHTHWSLETLLIPHTSSAEASELVFVFWGLHCYQSVHVWEFYREFNTSFIVY